MSSESARLTSLSHGAGCACKLSPQELAPLVRGLPIVADPDLLVGFDTTDDAAVYRVSDRQAVVLTADFFTPIVDDPYDFGRIAAANALSDIYAMGAKPLLAINLVAFSVRDLGPKPLERILAGGSAVLAEAGAALAGGHSIDDPEPKYGMAIVGTVHPERVLTNAGARAGDHLFLSKPIGSGLATTAAQRGLVDHATLASAISVMTELNADAASAAADAGSHAMTDVTGFGLTGHLHEICRASGLAAAIDVASVPMIEGVLDLATDQRCVAGGSRRNLEHAGTFTEWGARVSAEQKVVLTDAMTSGGVLIAAPPSAAHALDAARIGALIPGPAGRITVA